MIIVKKMINRQVLHGEQQKIIYTVFQNTSIIKNYTCIAKLIPIRKGIKPLPRISAEVFFIKIISHTMLFML